MMTLDMDTADLPPERLDQAVRAAQKLCADFLQVERQLRDRKILVVGLPERSALRGLLNFAQSTPSTGEATLFVRYQATRLGDASQFLTSLAKELDTNWSGSIVEMRRFLGILVRAGTVAHANAPKQSRPGGQPSGPGRPPGRRDGPDAGQRER